MDREPEAPETTDGAAEPAAEVEPRKRLWLRALVVLLGLVVVAAIALLVFGPRLLRARIEADARSRGIVLSFAEVDFSFSRLTLRGVEVKLDNVPDFLAGAGEVEVDLAEWSPTSVRAKDLDIKLFGTDVFSSIGAWKAAHPTALAMPVSSESARVEWRLSRGMEAAIVLDRASMAMTPDKGRVHASAAAVVGREAGPMKVDWVAPADGFVVQIQPSAPPLSAVHAEIRSAKDGSRVKLTLDRAPLAPLAAALGVPKGSEGLVADGEAEMPLPSFEHPEPLAGSLRMSVKGYVPPHPRDLDGILFGDTTTLRSKFLLADDYSGAKLSSVAVEAGALALSGSGDVTRDGFDARVSLKLKGTIPCTAVASSAAVARLGPGLGGFAGALAAGAVKGSVSVSLGVEAKASDIKGAKITQSAHIGCKVSVPGLPEIILQ